VWRGNKDLATTWQLPILAELQLMRKIVRQGASNSAEFADGLYWSATEFAEYQARLLRLQDGNMS
jgi:hypothetical protein